MNCPSVQELVIRAGALAERFAQRARASEAARRLSEDTVCELAESGLLRVLQPTRYGGYEMDMLTFVRLVLEIARRDAASGWIYAIFGIHNWWLGYVDPQLQEEMWGDRTDRLFADAFAPVGRVELVKGGYRLSGRWKFLSGVEWSDYVAVGAMLPGKKGREPEYVMFFLPRGDYRIEDEWHVVGLRATASNTVVVDSAFVPPHRLFPLGRVLATGEAPGQAVNRGSLYRVPFMVGAGAALAAPVVGAARGAVDQFRQWIMQREPLFAGKRQRESAPAQMALAEASTTLDMLEDLLYRYARETMAFGHEHRLPSPQERARFYAWRAFAVRQSMRVVDRLFELSGGHSLFEKHPLQRIWRDVYAAGQHVALNYESALEVYGRALVGLPSRGFF